MKQLRSILNIALGVLALAVLVAPLSSMAEETAKENKLSKAKEKYDADKDGKLSEEEKAAAREGAKEQAKQTREENMKEALAKYDANGNGKLDPEEKEKMKADKMAAKEAKKAEMAEKKAEREAKKAAEKK